MDSANRDDFLTTHWSVVAAAGGVDGEATRAALARLCEDYWYPLYAYLRRRGENADDASDLVQGFFADLLERRDIARLSRERGRFRAFLLAALKHFASNVRDRARAEKRGGGQAALGLDLTQADARWRTEDRRSPTDGDPERQYERAWALALLEHTLAGLRAEYERSGRGALFRALEPRLSARDDGPAPALAELAATLGSTEGALKVALFRLRRRWRERLRAEIDRTVARPEEVEDEIRALFELLG